MTEILSQLPDIIAVHNAVARLDILFPAMIGLVVFVICLCLAMYWTGDDEN